MLKQFRTYYYLLFSILLLGGCINDVELPEPKEGDVIFNVFATIDGEPLNLSAGKDERFMFTEVMTDTNNVLLFKGTIGNTGCQYCNGSLDFEFTQEEDNPQFPESLIAAGNSISYRNSIVPTNIIGYGVDFEMDLQGIAPFTMVWGFGDNTMATTTTTTTQHEYEVAGIYNVCVHVTDATGCKSDICRTISTDNSMNCAINFTVHNYTGFQNAFYFNTYSSGFPPFSYDWNIVVDTIINLNFIQASPTVLMNQIGIIPVTVFMTDAHNCQASVAQTIDFNNPDAICLQQYEYQSNVLTETGLLQDYFSTLRVRYVDEDGVVFASDLGEQANYTMLNILNVEEFEVNNDGQPTKKITLEFACRLYDEAGNSKDLENGLATIAVAYIL
jgi:PKD repeat protein